MYLKTYVSLLSIVYYNVVCLVFLLIVSCSCSVRVCRRNMYLNWFDLVLSDVDLSDAEHTGCPILTCVMAGCCSVSWAVQYQPGSWLSAPPSVGLSWTITVYGFIGFAVYTDLDYCTAVWCCIYWAIQHYPRSWLSNAASAGLSKTDLHHGCLMLHLLDCPKLTCTMTV